MALVASRAHIGIDAGVYFSLPLTLCTISASTTLGYYYLCSSTPTTSIVCAGLHLDGMVGSTIPWENFQGPSKSNLCCRSFEKPTLANLFYVFSSRPFSSLFYLFSFPVLLNIYIVHIPFTYIANHLHRFPATILIEFPLNDILLFASQVFFTVH